MMKWLSHPIQFLKKGYHEDGKYAISLIREIFNLDEMKGEIDREKELEESLELTEASSEKDLKKEYPLH